MPIRFETSCDGIDWAALKAALKADRFDNGRTVEQYERSARASHRNVFVYDDNEIVGNARVLSDGVCNAYVVDVWVKSAHRRQGIATKMVSILLQDLQGQHVYLFTDDMQDFYRSIGFSDQPTGMGRVVGHWLQNQPLT